MADDDALRRRGEAFLAMFDDADARRTRETTSNAVGKRGARAAAAATSTTRDASTREDARKRPREDAVVMSADASTRRAMSGASGRGVATVVFDGWRTRDAGETAAAATTSGAEAAARRMIDAKRARKAFMSADASRVFAEDVERRNEGEGDGANAANAEAERLRELREEVRRFGAIGLSKWDKQAMETERLRELGMKPKKAPRMAPALGLGLVKANEKREEAKRQEAFALGYKLEKKAKKGEERPRDRGVSWGASTFSNGVLRVNKRDMVNADKLVDTKAMLRSGPAGRARSGGGKGGKKGKKKVGRKSKR